MSVVNGQIANADTFNNAFGSKQQDNIFLGIQALANPSSGATVANAQQTINDNGAAIVVAQADIDAHEADLNNPHSVTKIQIGLGNCDNTADLDKPISIATQAALDLKASKIESIVNALIFG